MTSVESIETRVRLGRGRIALDCILSSAFYLFYWFYITWKQLKEETGNPHRPVWHALGLLVPIYGWFIVNRHLRTIKELQDKAEIKPSLNPGRLLTLFIVSNVLQAQSASWEGMTTLVLDIIGVALMVIFLVLSQRNLNTYWEHTKGTELAEARIGIGEVVFVVLGLAYWALYFV